MKISFKLISGMLVMAALTFLTPTASAQQANPWLRMFGDGTWWASLPADAKANFIDGYVTAMNHITSTARAFCAELAKEEKTSPNSQSAATVINECIAVNVIAESFDSQKADRHKVMDALNQFYSDSQNTRLPIETAMQYVADELGGNKSPNELEAELVEWRSIVNK